MSSLMFDADNQGLTVEKEEVINEATGKSEKKYKIKGIFSTIGEKNRNGRTYPRELWINEVNSYQNEIRSGSINTLMEYEHPARTEVDPMKAVSKIEKLWIDGAYVMGEAVLLDNPQANQLKSLIDNGVKISVSSRGVGSVKNGIVESFKLITYDIVPNPSDYNATMNGMCEAQRLCEGIVQGKSYEIDNFGNIVEKAEVTEEVKTEEATEVTGEVEETVNENNSEETVNENNSEEVKTEETVVENPKIEEVINSLREEFKESFNSLKESLKPEKSEVEITEEKTEEITENTDVNKEEKITEEITLAQKQDAIRDLFENFLQKI